MVSKKSVFRLENEIDHINSGNSDQFALILGYCISATILHSLLQLVDSDTNSWRVSFPS